MRLCCCGCAGCLVLYSVLWRVRVAVSAALEFSGVVCGLGVFGFVNLCGFFFFFQAEDGIRDKLVTGVQTCALPISMSAVALAATADIVLDGSDNFATRHAANRVCVRLRKPLVSGAAVRFDGQVAVFDKIGRASCRERGESAGGAVRFKRRVEGREAR